MRQLGFGIAMAHQKFRGRTQELLVELGKALLPEPFKVIAKSPHDQRGAVFLDRDLRTSAVDYPGMPGRSQSAVGAVFMHERRAIAILDRALANKADTELEEAFAHIFEPDSVQGVCCQ